MKGQAMHMHPRTRSRRNGIAAVTAIIFLTLLATLALAMYATSTLNVQTSRNFSDQQRARSIAESGLRFLNWRFTRMVRPKTTIGNITPAVATTLWPSIRTAIINDFAAMQTVSERNMTFDGTTLTSASIASDETNGRF